MASALLNYMDVPNLAPPLPEGQGDLLAVELSQASGMEVYPRSICATQHSLLFLGRREDMKYLGVICSAPAAPGGLSGRSTPVTLSGAKTNLTLCDTTAENAAALRTLLPFLVARPIGLRKSVGCGDRLGLATPGHVRAVRQSAMVPIFAQQSIRENARTRRTPQQVMDDAMWGVLQEGWREGFGADADHLKTLADIDVCAAAGYTFYTIDPGEYVDNHANTDSMEMLEKKVQALPWLVLEGTAEGLEQQLSGKSIDLGSFSATLSKEEVWRSAAKYGRALAHTVSMYRHLLVVMNQSPFELEMSVDETETVTSLAEHVYIAHELKRLGVKCVSLAPRYVGDFEKGVDYIGDLTAFEQSFARHLAVSQTYGPYKLSLHSGSDKFRVYPVAARVAGELVHLKTAGTSYLEALRGIADLNPSLFREIAAFAIEHYPADRATYHVSADLAKMPGIASLPDNKLATLLDDFHAREVLHVTFGSVVNHAPFREPFFSTLRRNEEAYYQLLEKHFLKHVSPFGMAAAHS
jgi:tagaturonate epimerase